MSKMIRNYATQATPRLAADYYPKETYGWGGKKVADILAHHILTQEGNCVECSCGWKFIRPESADRAARFHLERVCHLELQPIMYLD